MTKVLVNFAIFLGGIGFLFFLFTIIAGFLGCCAGITTSSYLQILNVTLIISVAIFIGCMLNNCMRSKKEE